MGVNASGLSGRRVGQAPEGDAVPPQAQCSLGQLAQVLSSLLRQPLSLEQVRDKTVGLGLLHHTESHEALQLTTQAASRLLLAGYQLPAQVELATYETLADHLRAQRLVFVLPCRDQCEGERQATPASTVVQVQAVHGESPGSPRLLFRECDGLPASVGPNALDDPLAAPWTPGSFLVVVAARAWSDLPQEGTVFFAGSRDVAGVYHWESAECDTDASGRILRY